MKTWLESHDINNEVLFQNCKIEKRTRETSGMHKAITMNFLLKEGFDIICHFEDDPIQIRMINEFAQEVQVVGMHHSLTEK